MPVKHYYNLVCFWGFLYFNVVVHCPNFGKILHDCGVGHLRFNDPDPARHAESVFGFCCRVWAWLFSGTMGHNSRMLGLLHKPNTATICSPCTRHGCGCFLANRYFDTKCMGKGKKLIIIQLQGSLNRIKRIRCVLLGKKRYPLCQVHV